METPTKSEDELPALSLAQADVTIGAKFEFVDAERRIALVLAAFSSQELVFISHECIVNKDNWKNASCHSFEVDNDIL